jgi:hypothetical protein
MTFSLGIVAMILPVLFFYGYKAFKNKSDIILSTNNLQIKPE